MLLQILLQVRRILVDDMVQLKNIAVADCLFRPAGEAVPLELNHIRQLPGCEQYIQGFPGLVG
ncbi:hypothetical protein D3C87_1842560 [compost metagenome]